MTLAEQMATVQTALHTARQQIMHIEHVLYADSSRNKNVDDAYRHLAAAQHAVNEAIDIMAGDRRD